MGSADIAGGGGRIRYQLGREEVEMGLGLIAAFVRASDAAFANEPDHPGQDGEAFHQLLWCLTTQYRSSKRCTA